jgi:hypothetical protein
VFVKARGVTGSRVLLEGAKTITANNTAPPFKPGTAVQPPLEEKFCFPPYIVRLNGRIAEDAGFASTAENDGDDSMIAICVVAGG